MASPRTRSRTTGCGRSWPGTGEPRTADSAPGRRRARGGIVHRLDVGGGPGQGAAGGPGGPAPGGGHLVRLPGARGGRTAAASGPAAARRRGALGALVTVGPQGAENRIVSIRAG